MYGLNKLLVIPLIFLPLGVPNDLSSSESAAKDEHSQQFLGVKVSLLPTFSNPENAKAEFMGKHAGLIRNIQGRYRLPELSVATAEAYKLAATMQASEGGGSEIFDVLRFLDYYENEVENAQISTELKRLEKEVASNALSDTEAFQSAKSILPISETNGNHRPVYESRNSGINLAAARAYAERHAKPGTYNRKYGYEKTKWVFDSDCTNFASQILHAGGVGMVHTNSTSSGWWWKSTTNRSASWINAHVFANYMGKGYSHKHWSGIASNVRNGDFIAADWTSDGTIDHIGFVHTVSGGKLLIAQHSADYLKWNGGWPDYSGKATYYRVRR